jgi:hypothetical protein
MGSRALDKIGLTARHVGLGSLSPFRRCLGQVGLAFNNGTQRDPIGSPFCVNLRHRSLLSITSSAVTSSVTFREVGSASQAVADNVISLPLLGT